MTAVSASTLSSALVARWAGNAPPSTPSPTHMTAVCVALHTLSEDAFLCAFAVRSPTSLSWASRAAARWCVVACSPRVLFAKLVASWTSGASIQEDAAASLRTPRAWEARHQVMPQLMCRVLLFHSRTQDHHVRSRRRDTSTQIVFIEIEKTLPFCMVSMMCSSYFMLLFCGGGESAVVSFICTQHREKKFFWKNTKIWSPFARIFRYRKLLSPNFIFIVLVDNLIIGKKRGYI